MVIKSRGPGLIANRSGMSLLLRAVAWVLYVGLWFYLSAGLLASLRVGRVQHRWYLLEKNRPLDYATRLRHPIEYWTSVAIQFLVLALVSWAGINAFLGN